MLRRTRAVSGAHPAGVREAKDSTEAAGHLSQWFGDVDQLALVASDIQPMQDRLGIGYRLRLHSDQWYVVEQRAYCDMTDRRIQHMDLLCPGFPPEYVPKPEHETA